MKALKKIAAMDAPALNQPGAHRHKAKQQGIVDETDHPADFGRHPKPASMSKTKTVNPINPPGYCLKRSQPVFRYDFPGGLPVSRKDGGNDAAGAGSEPSTCRPQLLQNRLPASNSSPQPEHCAMINLLGNAGDTPRDGYGQRLRGLLTLVGQFTGYPPLPRVHDQGKLCPHRRHHKPKISTITDLNQNNLRIPGNGRNWQICTHLVKS